VLHLAHVALRERGPEARPARVRVELSLRTEDREVAADAQVRAARVLLVERARVGRFRPRAPRYLVLLRREQSPPLLVSPDYAPDAARALVNAGRVRVGRGRRAD